MKKVGYYKVIATVEYPAWDEKKGIEFTVYGNSKRDAAKTVRQSVGYEDNCTGKGRVSLKAEYIGTQRP